ncbi:hypothetical protein WJX74_003914 [Apatococcus lobatus]|uniref:Uncharacterized protein n=1 Tax=Apatococcus lobatus TaxID=904363 RepID=A0AAW1RF21_9CHLO
MIKDQIAMSSGASHDQVATSQPGVSTGDDTGGLQQRGRTVPPTVRMHRLFAASVPSTACFVDGATSVSAHSSAVVEPHWPAAVQR